MNYTRNYCCKCVVSVVGFVGIVGEVAVVNGGGA